MCRSDRGESTREKNVVYVSFIGLEKVYNRVNRKALWQVLRLYDVGEGKLLSMHVDSSASVRVKGDE